MECFFEIGFFGEAMHIVYNPKNTSPNDIARDNLCGIFNGYLTKDKKLIKETDIFYHMDLFDDIFN